MLNILKPIAIIPAALVGLWAGQAHASILDTFVCKAGDISYTVTLINNTAQVDITVGEMMDQALERSFSLPDQFGSSGFAYGDSQWRFFGKSDIAFLQESNYDPMDCRFLGDGGEAYEEGGTQVSTPSGGSEIYNATGQSLGGKLRAGPGVNYPQMGSLSRGTWVTILRNAGERFDGYDWFEVALDDGRRAYQWGGVMCSTGNDLTGLFSSCSANPIRVPQPTDTDPGFYVANDAVSWGGNVRAGPGQQYSRITALNELEPVTILNKTDIIFDGYNWFQIRFRGDRVGFQWGGLICSDTQNIPGTSGPCNLDVPRLPDESGLRISGPDGSTWKAFAVGDKGIWGHGVAADRYEAEQNALEHCAFDACRIENVTDRTCHSMASAASNVWFGTGDSNALSSGVAMAQCFIQAGGSCQLAYTYCN